MNDAMIEAAMPVFKFEEYLDDNEALDIMLFIIKMKRTKIRKIKAELKSLGIE